ncbi:MAG: hypothetical protein IKT00_06295 [Prevotella sp.]|nr:hypothetical protein [Prevotella sp.]
MKTGKTLQCNATGSNIFCKAATTLLFAVTLSVGLTACSDNNDFDSNDRAVKEQSHPVTFNSHDDLAIFQNTIAEINEQGQITNYIYGEPIDSKDPLHLYIGVENIKEAEEIFNLWFANDVVISPFVNGGRAVNLTDRNGKPQGTIFFTPGTEENHVAEVTVSSDTQLKGFQQITFLKNEAWPKKNLLMAGKKYYKFDIVKNIKMAGIQDCLKSNDKSLNFVCIQGSGNGVKPIFCAVSNEKYKNPLSNKYLGIMRDSKYCPGEGSSPTAFNIQKILHADWNTFVETFNEAGSGPLLSGPNYWYDETHFTFIFQYNGVICYNSGYTYGEDDCSQQYYFLYRIFGRDDSEIYDGASL